MNSVAPWHMRWPCMEGEAMEELNRGFAAFRGELSTDALAVKRAELGIVSFGPMPAVRRSAAWGVDAELSRALGGYLASVPVNDRTDDDKALILASRWQA